MNRRKNISEDMQLDGEALEEVHAKRRKLDRLDLDLYKTPHCGRPVDQREFRKAGQYIIGSEIIGHRPVRSMVQFLSKKDGTDQFYQLKILQLTRHQDPLDERQGKILMHTEHSLLSLLQNEEGVIKQHGMFSDLAYEEQLSKKRKPLYTGHLRKRLVLVLDCLIQHPFSDKSDCYVNLQEHILNLKKLSECEALFIFYEIVKIVENIHKKNVVHRDLKLGNFVLNKVTKKIVITNFCLGRHVINENTKFVDKKGSPAYISPDVISGKPYKGKPSDMWSLGVVFFIMLFGNFPFFKSSSKALFDQILAAEFDIPRDTDVSVDSIDVIEGLLTINPEKRLTAQQLRVKLESMLALNRIVTPDQCVPFGKTRTKYFISFKKHFDPYTNDQTVPGLKPTGDEQNIEISSASASTCVTTISIARRTRISCPANDRNVDTLLDCVPDRATTISRIDEDVTQRLGEFRTVFPTRTRRRPLVRYSPDSALSDDERNAATVSTVETDHMVRDFVYLLEQQFISGRILAPTDGALREFNGLLTFSVALRVHRYILTEFSASALVQFLFIVEDQGIVAMVKNLFVHCGVRMERSTFGPAVSAHQTSSVLFILTNLLKVSGYNNNFFLTQLDTSGD